MSTECVHRFNYIWSFEQLHPPLKNMFECVFNSPSSIKQYTVLQRGTKFVFNKSICAKALRRMASQTKLLFGIGWLKISTIHRTLHILRLIQLALNLKLSSFVKSFISSLSCVDVLVCECGCQNIEQFCFCLILQCIAALTIDNRHRTQYHR